MNDLLPRLRATLRRFFLGRAGVDALGRALLGCALLASLAGALLRLRLPVLLADALLLLALFRTLSRDLPRRALENRRYLERQAEARRALGTFVARLRARKQYRYYRCPKCRMLLRVPRGKGRLTITCRACGTRFEGKS